MTRRHARNAAVVALLVGGVAAYRWWTGPERQIHAILADVAAALTHAEADGGLQALSAVAALQSHLAVDVTLESPRARIAGRQEVVAAAARLRAGAPMMRLRFFDPRIAFPDDTSATLWVTAEVTTRNAAGQDVVDVHQVLARLEAVEEKWVVSSARTAPAGEPDA